MSSVWVRWALDLDLGAGVCGSQLWVRVRSLRRLLRGKMENKVHANGVNLPTYCELCMNFVR